MRNRPVVTCVAVSWTLVLAAEAVAQFPRAPQPKPQRIDAAGTVNAKFSPGALVDIEYLVQGLQISHGQKNPALRSTTTREAMAASDRLPTTGSELS